jgi:poly(3-hydroxybutyrate) depolymerase
MVGRRKLVVQTACVLGGCLVGATAFLELWNSASVLPDEQITVGETKRSYRLVVPRRLTKPAPIVFAFHGVGDSPENMARYSKLDRLAAREGFLLVYPAARKGMWATMEVDERPLDANPDLQFFDELLEHLSKQFDIDSSRVFVIGMSNGASFAQLLTIARPDKIAAAAAHSGPAPRVDRSSVGGPPLMLIVGDEDFAHFAMSSDAKRYRAGGRKVEFISIPGLGHAWSAKHNWQIWRFLSRYSAPAER